MKTNNITKLFRLFKEEMSLRYDQKEAEGWRGWNLKSKMKSDEIKLRIFKNVLSGDMVDVANLAMFYWNLYGEETK
jgi:hypothetical protein